MDDLTVVTSEVEHIAVSNCYTCSPESSDKFLDCSLHDLKILHTNIRSINSNFDNLVVFMSRLSYLPDIIILTECWLSKCPTTPLLTGYNSHTSSYKTQNEGVVVYLRDCFDATVETPIFNEANVLLLKFSNKAAFIAIYRSPSYRDLTNFLSSLDSLLSNLTQFKTVAIIGDINLNIAPGSIDPNADEYLNLTASHAMLPAYTLPTRLSNCLDHVILRTQNTATTLISDSLITDHSPVITFCNLNVKTKTPHLTSLKIDLPKVADEINSTDFSSIFQCHNPNEAAESLVSIMSLAIKSHSHVSQIPSRRRIIKPWITPGLLRCIHHRDKLHRKFKKNQEDETHKLIFCRYRTFCNNLLKKVNREYECSEFRQARNNPKATWKLVKRVANLDQPRHSASELLNCSTEPSQSVDKVNNYFANVGGLLAAKIEHSVLYKYLSDSRPNFEIPGSSVPSAPQSMALYSVDCAELENIILSLKDNCAVGFDGISTSIVKATRHILTPILVFIFNLCFSTGTFPNVFKTAVVHPIYKSGDKDNVANYRPISVLSTLSKIFEKVINQRLTKYLNKFNLLSKNQYGFRTGKSTEDAVLELTDTVIGHWENKSKTLAIFLDLSKAFDTVSIPILLSKLEHLGIRGTAHDLFKSYLTGRKQIIKIENYFSNQETITFGVPQGSVLGPPLFLIYVNELCQLSLPNCKIISYADDTALIVHGRDWTETRLNSEFALSTVMRWLTTNLLTLNVNKTKFITFCTMKTSQPPTPIEIRAHTCPNLHANCGCQQLENTSSIKYLGVTLDSNLKWKQHIASTVARVRKLIYIFKKLRGVADFGCLLTIYFALAQSVLGYCLTVWGGAGKTLMLRVERAQRAVLKVLARKPIRYSTSSLYTLCQVLTVRQLFILQTILRKHSQLIFDPKCCSTRRSNRVCNTESPSTVVAGRHYKHISSKIYNKLNKSLRIYTLTKNKCKMKLDSWLKSQNYDETEKLVEV